MARMALHCAGALGFSSPQAGSAAPSSPSIIAFFGGVIVAGAGERWNELLPDLYDGEALLSTAAIGSHFMAGGVLLLLGPAQLIGSVRRSVPALHRWLGRICFLSAGLAGLAGLGFIWGRGTIGGPLMDTGFGIYGALMVLCAAMAYARARADKYDSIAPGRSGCSR